MAAGLLDKFSMNKCKEKLKEMILKMKGKKGAEGDAGAGGDPAGGGGKTTDKWNPDLNQPPRYQLPARKSRDYCDIADVGGAIKSDVCLGVYLTARYVKDVVALTCFVSEGGMLPNDTEFTELLSALFTVIYRLAADLLMALTFCCRCGCRLRPCRHPRRRL